MFIPSQKLNKNKQGWKRWSTASGRLCNHFYSASDGGGAYEWHNWQHFKLLPVTSSQVMDSGKLWWFFKKVSTAFNIAIGYMWFTGIAKQLLLAISTALLTMRDTWTRSIQGFRPTFMFPSDLYIGIFLTENIVIKSGAFYKVNGHFEIIYCLFLPLLQLHLKNTANLLQTSFLADLLASQNGFENFLDVGNGTHQPKVQVFCLSFCSQYVL